MAAAAPRANSGSATVTSVLDGLGGNFKGIRPTNVSAAAAAAAAFNRWRINNNIKPLSKEEQDGIAHIVARLNETARAAADAQRELEALARQHNLSVEQFMEIANALIPAPPDQGGRRRKRSQTKNKRSKLAKKRSKTRKF